GLLLHTSDGGVTWESVELSTHANLSRLFFIAPDCGWVVGTSGAIFKYGQVTNLQKGASGIFAHAMNYGVTNDFTAQGKSGFLLQNCFRVVDAGESLLCPGRRRLGG